MPDEPTRESFLNIVERSITAERLIGDIAGLPDLVNRDFTATAPGAKLVGDITYIRTWEGWLYLATVLDCFSKKVLGYAGCHDLGRPASRVGVGQGVAGAGIAPGRT